MKINDELILNLEKLSKLNLSNDEREQIKAELEKMIEMFSKISDVDTGEIEPLIHMSPALNVLRKDTAKNDFTFAEVRGNAPHLVENYFAVPKVID